MPANLENQELFPQNYRDSKLINQNQKMVHQVARKFKKPIYIITFY